MPAVAPVFLSAADEPTEITAQSASFSIWPVGIIAGMLLIFAVLSYSAVLGKSATYDEPLHVVGGEVHRYLHDFRINPEDPALFGWWSSLPHRESSMPLDTTDPHYEGAPNNTNEQWWFVISSLYNRGAAVADGYLNTSRFMFVLLGIVLGVLIARWAYEIAGPAAAIAATALFCLDPNMLGHASLVKNDVPLSMLMCALGYCVWRIGKGRGGNVLFILAAALLCGLALNVKFSAVLFFPILIALLSIRALLPQAWQVGGIRLRRVVSRLSIAIVAGILSIFVAWGITWTVYGFRYSATVSGDSFNTAAMVKRAVQNRISIGIECGTTPPMTADELNTAAARQIDAGDLALPVRVDLWMQSHHILPESWLFGFLYTYATTLIRSSFLMGDIRVRGWWYYFPATILFKTPTATLAAGLLAVPSVVITYLVSRKRLAATAVSIDPSRCKNLHAARREAAWTAVVLLLPPLAYLTVALFTNLNLGLRHILPIYPYLFIVLGWVFARLRDALPRQATIFGGVVLLGLLAETAAAYPNYIAFFNAPSGGSRGGIRLLGDSNLDWGQDLTALVKWQHDNPSVRLYFSYFGLANPSSYGLDFVNLPGGYPLAPSGNLSAGPGVIAMSATNLQGIYLNAELVKSYRNVLKDEPPFEVLNGTIYLYYWPPQPK